MWTVRQQIRDQIKSTIAANVPALEGRVTGVRTFARGKDRLPDCEVVTLSEERERLSEDDAQRSMHTVAVALYDSVDAAGTVQDRLDAIAQDVITALDADATLDAICDGFQSVDYEFDMPEGGAEQPASLTITCVAMTLA